NTFHWDDQNLGHRVTAEMRVGRGRGYALGASSYDVMTPVETWQLPDPDAALAALFGHRDFRDHFNRHGAKATATFNMSARSSLAFDWSDERWASVNARRVFSVFGNGKSWRANPLVDAGRFHLGVLRANIDTRNDEDNPSTGWLIVAEYEPGTVDVSQCSNGGPPPPGNPAQCERVALGQLEYRNELRSSLFDFLNARAIRLRGIGFTVEPTAVAFVDAGRGWLVGQPSGTLQYSSHSLPRFGTFRTDVGLGLDLGIIGLYAAKAVSSSKEPANVFLRVRRRF